MRSLKSCIEMKVSFTGLRLTAVAGVLTGHFYNHKKTSRSTGGLVESLMCTYLIAILIKSTDQVLGNHLRRAALNLVSFYKMH